MTEGLTCQELVELVTDYLEGALPGADVERFEGHLAICPGCSTYVDQFRETVRLTGRLREQDIGLDPVMRDRLLDAFRDFTRA